MKNSRKDLGLILTGMALGTALCGSAVAAGIVAEPGRHDIYVDGQQVYMTAYNIDGNNYVRLRDIGQAVGFNVYWSDGVQVESNMEYTGVPPAKPTVSDESSELVVVLLTETASSSTDDVEALRMEIAERTNDLRQARDLPDLTADDMLMQAAQVRAEEMAVSGTYSHTRPDGTKRTTVTDSPYTGENIHRVSLRRLNALNQSIAETAVQDWSRSDSHLDTMLIRNLDKIGVGLAKGVNASGEDCWYCVQMFLWKGYTVTWVDEPAI